VDRAPFKNVLPVELVLLNRKNIAYVFQILDSSPAKFLHNHIFSSRNPHLSSVHWNLVPSSKAGHMKGISRKAKELDDVPGAVDSDNVLERSCQRFKFNLPIEPVVWWKKCFDIGNRLAAELDHEICVAGRARYSIEITRVRSHEHIGQVSLVEGINNRQGWVARFHTLLTCHFAIGCRAFRELPGVFPISFQSLVHPPRGAGSEFRLSSPHRLARRVCSRRQISRPGSSFAHEKPCLDRLDR
jgi:hypothetical protein